MTRALQVTVGSAAVLIAAAFACVFSRPAPPVTVVLVNASQIAWAKVTHERGPSWSSASQSAGPVRCCSAQEVRRPTLSMCASRMVQRSTGKADMQGRLSLSRLSHRFTGQDRARAPELLMPANMALQWTRRPRVRSGRSRCSPGSRLNAVALGGICRRSLGAILPLSPARSVSSVELRPGAARPVPPED